MPTLMELRSRFEMEQDVSHLDAGSGESLIADVRGRLTPAQVVENKLRRLLLKPSLLSSATSAGRRRKAK